MRKYRVNIGKWDSKQASIAGFFAHCRLPRSSGKPVVQGIDENLKLGHGRELFTL